MKTIWANCIHAGENKPCSLLGIKGTDSLINKSMKKPLTLLNYVEQVFKSVLHIPTLEDHLHTSDLAPKPGYVGTTFR